MAITKIHAVKHTLGKSITYIGNGLKTENGEYISTYGCAYETAELEFELTAQQAKYDGGKNQAYHIIQSFKQGEVTAEQCHEIGKKLADEVLGGKYEYVLCTHTDKGYYHNHIIFNAVSFKDHKRYRSDKKSYYRIREISDKICAEYGLNVIKENKRQSSYEHKKTYISNKYRIKKAIDECILYAIDYEDFLKQMQNRNYIARQDEWLWFRDGNNKRFTKTDTIDKAYAKANIEKHIRGLYRPTTIDLLIDIERNIKCQHVPPRRADAIDGVCGANVLKSKGYEQWAKIHNLKLVAKTINILTELHWSYDDLVKRVSEKSEKLKAIQNKIKSDKQRISEIDTVMKNLNTYHKLKPIYEEYSKKNPLMKNTFYNKHKQEINLFQRVTNELKPHCTANNKLPNIKNLEAEKRIKELDRLFKSIYEDKANGSLIEIRFRMLADDYEKEQEDLRKSLITLTAEIEQQEEQMDNIERFIEKVHKYFDLQELTPTILNDMVKRVYVHAPQKINGKRTQEIDIYYDLVGFLPLSLFQTEKQDRAS